MSYNPFKKVEPVDLKKSSGLKLEMPTDIPLGNSKKEQDPKPGLFSEFTFNAENLRNMLDEEAMAEAEAKKALAAEKRAEAKELKKLQDDSKKVKLNSETGDEDKEEKFYEKRFEESLDSLTDLEGELSVFKDEIKQDLTNIKNSKQRGVLTHVTNQTANVLSSYKAILDIKKEKTAILKTISDLEIKKIDKTKSAQGGLMSEAALMDQVFNKVMGSGGLNSGLSMDYDDDMELKVATRSALSSGDLSFTDNELAVAYEGSAQVVVLFDQSSGEWRFAAIDGRTDQEIEGYPLPSIRAENEIRFDFDRRKAKDKLNRTYDIWLL